jgi:3-deoxy-manno-octulosonate cytidylyltransferase (CMP-KDO synthetase)
MASSRLPDKPLADIAGKPMIAHVLARGEEAGIGPVVVACDDPRIRDAVEAAGGRAVLTDPDLASGSDRVCAAVRSIDPDGEFDVVLNLQGDVPLIDPEAIRATFAPLRDPAVDIGTIATEIRTEAGRTDPGMVKTIGTPVDENRLRALYFTRATAPSGPGPLYQHIGLYAYRRAALERFVALPPSTLERRESLEQLRALEAGMRIDVSMIDSTPMDVNTPADLDAVRAVLGHRTTTRHS